MRTSQRLDNLESAIEWLKKDLARVSKEEKKREAFSSAEAYLVGFRCQCGAGIRITRPADLTRIPWSAWDGVVECGQCERKYTLRVELGPIR
jgi:hypothetical protein